MPAGKLGKLLPHPEDTHPRLHLKTALSAVAAAQVPLTGDYLSRVPDWPMYGNDQYGDCVWAGFGHQEESYSLYGQGAEVKLTDADIITGYESTGFNPNDPSTDRGTNVQDGLSYYQKTGLGSPSHNIAGYLAVDPTNASEVAAAIYFFGHVGFGFAVPQYAMDQFNNGQPWDVDPNGDQTVLGGHYVCAGAYDLTAKTWKVVTWGAVQTVTQAFFDFWASQNEQGEAWVAVTQEWINAQGMNPSGLNLDALSQEWATIQPGAPFPLAPVTPPTPVPPTPVPPVPTPTPVPPSPVDPADVALAAVLHKIRAHPLFHDLTHHQRAVIDAWFVATGL